ncbi:MAG: DNA gyrase subunit B [Thermoguttaceae bacterium]|nr:DNA gyrase subunit B [Thermoguttaceae bacterium]
MSENNPLPASSDNQHSAMTPPHANDSYTAKDLEHLSDREHVRIRPAMYIGDTGTRGLHHLVTEVVDNSIDEALAGFANTISVTINSDGSVTVEDNGRGIPVEIHPDLKKSTLEGVMTVLKFGGKFSKGAYQTSGGLHGVGVTVVNFLSEWCVVEVRRDGYVWQQEYERGIPAGDISRMEKTDGHGTKTTFKPDPQIFPDTKFDYNNLFRRLQDLAFLNHGVKIIYKDERTGQGETFEYENGLIDFIHNLNRSTEPIHSDVIYLSGESEGVRVEIAIQYTSEYTENVRSYVNNIFTHEGGTHLSGFRSALTRCLNNYGKNQNLFKNQVLSGEDFREGLTAVISTQVPNPRFEGQTKTKLGNGEVEGIVNSIVGDGLSKYLEEHPQSAQLIVKKAILAAEARESARKARMLVRERKGALNHGGMPGKLRDCSSREMEKCELYLVEGNSAGGSAEGGRIREFQAILPLRGKVINAYKAREVKVLANEEVKSMITALGCGIGDEVDLTKRRYGKVVIMTDADVDGSHIRTLLLTFFYRQMYRLVQAGCVYAALPPLYKVRKKGSKNAAPRYVQTDEEMRRELLESGIAGAVFDPQDGRLIEGDALGGLCKTLSQIEDSIQALERRGISLREHAARQDKETARLPYYHVFWKKEEHWFLTRRDLDEFTSKIEAETGESVEKLTSHDSLGSALSGGDAPIASDGEDLGDRGLHITELHEVRSLNRQLADLREMGFEIDALIPEKRTGLEGSRYYLRKGDSETGIDDLRELLTAIRHSGEKGYIITRFKGLGEMDPEELRETTLDPKNRSLVQITMEDASAADDLFRILMGDSVEPRREFIEQNALEVKNLDV